MPSIFLPNDAVRGYRKSVTVHDSQRIQLKNQSFSFCQVAAKFMVEDDEEQMKEELKEAFRIYDKEVTKALKKNWNSFKTIMHHIFSAKASSRTTC